MRRRSEMEEIKRQIEGVLRMLEAFGQEMKKLLENVTKINENLNQLGEKVKDFSDIFAKEKEKKEEIKGIVVLLDLENLFFHLSDLNLVFNPQALLEEIKKVFQKPIVKAKAFYGRFLHPFYRLALSQSGYEIINCPPIALKGKDTVDEQILNDAHFWAKVDFVDSLVIVSGDKDMVLPINILQKAGKNVVLVKLDKMSRVLMNKEGTIKLRLSSVPSGLELMDERTRIFLSYLEAIKDLSKLLPTEPEFVFLLWVLSQLPQKAPSGVRRGFQNLAGTLWDDAYVTVYQALRGNIEKRDTERILHILLEKTDILERRKWYNPLTKHEEVYYIFNPKSNLWPKVLRRIEELCNTQPRWSEYFKSVKL